MTDECYGTGFALSGGFVKGYAHLGALQALFEYGIRPEIIAGVSIGAVAGVFIADGKRPEEVLELFMSREFRSFTGFTRSRGGFMTSITSTVSCATPCRSGASKSSPCRWR